MPWVVKVVAQIRRTGPSGQPAALRTTLAAAQPLLTADCLAALAVLEPGASIEWSMYAEAVPQAGANITDVYPKAIVTLPSHEADPRPRDPTLIYTKLRLVRDAIIARIESLRIAGGWTILVLNSKQYGDA